MYINIILPIILYGGETWSLRLWEEHRLRVLRGTLGPKRENVTGLWGKLQNEELNDRHSSPNIVRVIKSRRMRWAGHVARRGEGGVYKGLVGKPEGKRPLGRPRSRREYNIIMDPQEVRCRGMYWIGLAQDIDRWWAIVNAAMNIRFP
jgi:hypothetical protein